MPNLHFLRGGALKNWRVIPTGALYPHSTAEKTMVFPDPPGALNFLVPFATKGVLLDLHVFIHGGLEILKCNVDGR
jgi:hypothetical protein